MDVLKIKYQNQLCSITALTADFNAFLSGLEEKLKLHFFQQKVQFHAFFSFPYELSKEELLSLYQICDHYHALIDGFSLPKKDASLKVMNHCFYAGNSYVLLEDTVYIGDIESDVDVSCACNLYVIGTVRGKIDLLFPQLNITAIAFDDARIRIYDTKFQNMTNFSTKSVYYDNGKLLYR